MNGYPNYDNEPENQMTARRFLGGLACMGVFITLEAAATIELSHGDFLGAAGLALLGVAAYKAGRAVWENQPPHMHSGEGWL